MNDMLKYWELIDNMRYSKAKIFRTQEMVYKTSLKHKQTYIIFLKFQSAAKTNGESYMKQMILDNSMCVWNKYRS